MVGNRSVVIKKKLSNMIIFDNAVVTWDVSLSYTYVKDLRCGGKYCGIVMVGNHRGWVPAVNRM